MVTPDLFILFPGELFELFLLLMLTLLVLEVVLADSLIKGFKLELGCTLAEFQIFVGAVLKVLFVLFLSDLLFGI